ncbi:MAG: tRNA pseudouridine(55) synthase TruB [Clostridiales bacterium]|nr:tRNA pseudouridine(55) synthase TruB [Clostridiales bacterium]
MTGFINIIKPSGVSSAYAVGGVKKKFNCPCGHMGTLDPMADGVLPVGVGKASRLFQYLLEKEKTYVARFIFGYTTDTLDITGQTTEKTDKVPTLEDIKQVLPKFIGEIEQMPPKYSAKCINGKRSYQLARQGVEFTLKPKTVTILDLQCLSQISENEFEFRIDCKGGTYIRSLARDIALATGSLGVMSKLTRTACGVFNMQNGVTSQELFDSVNPEQYLIKADSVINFEKLNLTKMQAQKILDGVYENYGFSDGVYRVYNQGDFIGVGTVNDGILRINSYVR